MRKKRGCLFFYEVFLRGTLAPSFRACDNPIAMACFLLVTFLPDRPLFRVPFFRSCMAFSTFLDAFLLYLAIFVTPFSFPCIVECLICFLLLAATRMQQHYGRKQDLPRWLSLRWLSLWHSPR